MFLEELFGLNGQVSVIIGGAGVLGSSMALGLAKAGSKIAILDINEDKGINLAKEIRKLGREAIFIKVDVTSKKNISNAEKEVNEEFGRVDTLINAPGINSATPFFEITEQEWTNIMDINLKSIFLSCQIFGKNMIEKKLGGSIINISSASSDPPLSKVFTYSVSKAGINNLTKNLAREWAPFGVRVNAIRPGFFPAEQNRKILTKERINSIMKHTPMKRFGEPNELIGVIILLSSRKASSFITGSIINVDGGYLAMTI
jgi:NAD(P)-dependent dehydrogenase (short-subunit alcohol dehydrogenase family)